MAGEELSLDGQGANKGGSKKKIIIITVAVLLLVGGIAATYYFFFSDGMSNQGSAQLEEQMAFAPDNNQTAIYVAMPRPFMFNIMDGKRDRLVQIKVQLMVRGVENEALARRHVPLLEGTLVRIFSAATVTQLRSPDGKDQLRANALDAINQSTINLEGKALIDAVLFTGFVLQ